jgi:hypothetical protein
MAPFVKLNPCGYLRPPVVLWENHLQRGENMQEQLEIVDLGDAMAETKCSITGGSTYDFLYGPFHWTC